MSELWKLEARNRIEPSFSDTRVMKSLTPTGNMIAEDMRYSPPKLDVGEYDSPKFSDMEFSIEKVAASAQKRAIPADYGIREIPKIKYRYDEDKLLDELRAYVDSTYSAHYTTKESEIQAIDAFKALGSLFTTSRDLAIKYLWRVRKKGTKADAKKDLMKVMHYTLFMLHSLEQEKD